MNEIVGLDEYQAATDSVAMYPGNDSAFAKTVSAELSFFLQKVAQYEKTHGSKDTEWLNSLLPLIGAMQNTGLLYTSLGLAGEAGEFCDKVKKMLRDSQGVVSEELRDSLILELGDVLWYVAQAGRQLKVPMSEIATKNMEKLWSRKSRDVLGGSGDNR